MSVPDLAITSYVGLYAVLSVIQSGRLLSFRVDENSAGITDFHGVTLLGNTVSWYAGNGADPQGNTKNITFRYVVLGQ